MLYTTKIEKIKRVLLIMIALMTVMMGYYIWKHNTQDKTEVKPISIGHLENDADVLVSDVELTEIANEQILWTLEAKEAKVYNARKETKLREIEVDFYDEAGQKSMHLVSDRGLKDDKTGNVIASGNVQATSFVEGVTLKTSELMYDAKRKKIVSDEHVIIERGNLIISGEGLESNLSLTEARVLRNVTTSFVTEAME